MIKTNIKIRVTPEQSKRVQEICFSNGIYCNDIGDKYVELNENFRRIYIEDNILFESIGEIYFNTSKLKEIDAHLFIKTNGTCEENSDNGAKSCDMLQSENKELQKKIENLHIALNKKVFKNKRQKEQIAILFKQKDEYKQNIDIALKALNKKIEHLTTKNEELESNLEYKNNYIKLLKEKESKSDTLNKTLSETQTVLDDLNKTIDLLEDRIKEKETIISYLECKLKLNTIQNRTR